jgi:peroxiredoxin
MLPDSFSMTHYNQLPPDLPIPIDDGATNHLIVMTLPNISLKSSRGYCYPMTGQPNVPLPEGWDQIPGARGCTTQSCSFRDHYQ